MSIEANPTRSGFAQALAAYVVWGLFPLYLLPLRAVGAGEILAARIVWSLVFVGGLVVVLGRWPTFVAALTAARTLRALTASALFITVNWLVYIWAVQHGHLLEASLGYFLNPLVNVLLGVAVLRERLNRLQIAAVIVAAAGVAVLATGSGGAVWITGVLAVSFSVYGLIRKVAPVEALEGLAVETALLTPFALAYLAWLGSGGALVFGTDGTITTLLVAAGIVTATPLLLFAAAARKLPYVTVGILQYVTPMLQFAMAVLVFGEALTWRHLVCFSLIWVAIALFVAGLVRSARSTA